MLDGVLRGIDEGYFQSAIADSAYEFEKALGTGDRVIVGVNRYTSEEEEDLDILRIGQEVEHNQVGRLQALRNGRHRADVDAALDALREAAASDANLMPLIVEAARRRATQGEIVQAMKDVFGGYREPARI